MKPTMGWACALLLCLSVMPATSHADAFDAARAAIRKHMHDNAIPATAVALWRDGEIVWEEGFGFADRESGIPASAHTMFCLASVSKTMTATALMTLVQSGKVDLDKPANDYLGKDGITVRIGDPGRVTVRRIADHTSGLAGGDQFFYGADTAKLPSLQETIQRYAVVVAPAGERYWYSNIGYGVLGHLVEQVSGRPYGEFMREQVFLPLGMRHTALNVPTALEHQQAVRYDHDRQPIPFYLSAEPASASIYASAHDLARFGLFMLKRRLPDQAQILSDASIDAMSADAINADTLPVRPAEEGENGYGVGLSVGSMGGYRTLGHGGSSSGVSSSLVLLPSEGVGIVMLANVDGGVSRKILQDILKTQLPAWRDAPQETATPPLPTKRFEPPPDLVGAWAGQVHTYEGEQPMRIEVLPGGDVHVQIGAETRWSETVLQSVLAAPAFKHGQLTGRAMSRIVTGDTQRRDLPYIVSLRLNLREGGVLNGTAMAASVFDGFWESTLPYWTDLKKVSDSD